MRYNSNVLSWFLICCRKWCTAGFDRGRRIRLDWKCEQPKRTVQSGIGDVPVQVPKTRDRSGAGLHFTSNLLPPYLRKTCPVEELLPWLYLKGVSTGDFKEALTCLLGESRPRACRRRRWGGSSRSG